MKNDRIVISALLCAMFLANAGISRAEEAKDFNWLKQQIEGTGGSSPSSPVDIQDLGNVTFNGKIDVKNGVKATISGGDDNTSTSFTPQGYQSPGDDQEHKDPTYKKNAFTVQSGGDLTLEGLSITGFGTKKYEPQSSGSPDSTSLHGAVIDVLEGGKLKIGPGVEFSDNVKARSDQWGGTIANQGEITIESGASTEKKSGDVLFDYIHRQSSGRDDQYDIEMRNGSKLTITGDQGKVTFANGIVSFPGASNATITHDGDNEVQFGGKNGNYVGKFINQKGTVTVLKNTSSFLGGESTFKAGTLKWETTNVNRGSLKFGENTNLIVGTSDAEGGAGSVLTLDGKNDTISTTINMTVNNGSTLTLSNFDGKNKEAMTLMKKINGEGSLIFDNDNITLDGAEGGLANTLSLTTRNNTQLTLSNFTGDKDTLKVVASGTNNNLDLVLNNYTGEFDTDPMTVDGTSIKSLTFSGTKNSVTGALTIKETGKTTNSSSVNTTITGDVTIESSSGDTDNLTNQQGAQLNIEKGSSSSGANGFVNKGKVKNDGIINLSEDVTGKNAENGSITGTGDLVVDGDFSNEDNATINVSGDLDFGTLTNKHNITVTGEGGMNVDGLLDNQSGNIDLSQATGEFKVGGAVQNSAGTIKGQSATFQSYRDDTGNGTSLELTGDLTVKGSEEKKDNTIQNAGSVKAKSITVEQGGITNTGSITTTENGIALTDGNITNNAKGTITSAGDITANDITNTGGSTDDESATITSKNGKITASGAVSNVGSKDKISAKSMQLGSISQNEGTIESTEGDITVSGAVQNNAGSLTSAGKLNVTGDLSNTGKVSMKGGSLGNVSNNESGSITNNGDLTISGALKTSESEDPSSATFNHNGGNLTFSGTGDASGYKGTYNQTGGTATTIKDKLFAGEKNVSGGTLYASSSGAEEGGSLWKGVVNLSESGVFDFTSDNGGEIKNDLLKFGAAEGGKAGGSAVFKGATADGKYYTLSGDIENASNGSITFNNTNVALKKADSGDSTEFDFKNFTLQNSTLNLATQKESDNLDKFTLNNFNATDNSSVDLNLKLVGAGKGTYYPEDDAFDSGNERYLDGDRLTFKGSSSGTLSVGKVYFTSDSGGEDGFDFETKEGEDLIKNEEGSSVRFNTGQEVSEDVFVGTTDFEYDLEVKEHTLGLKVLGAASENTLYKANKMEGERRFFIKKGTTYNIGKSLDTKEDGDSDNPTTAKGNFYVYGEDRDSSILSAKIKESESVTEKHGSLFEIKSNEGDGEKTNLSISDLTIQDAQSSERGGVVVSNSDKDSRVTLDNVTVQNNSSSKAAETDKAKGGAIYNNGGKSTDPSSIIPEEAGLALTNVKFAGNTATSGETEGKTAYGGAVYNDKEGQMVMSHVTTTASKGKEGNEAGQNDIYNAGKALVDNSTFGTLYTNAGNATSTFNETNSFTTLVNEESGTVQFASASGDKVSTVTKKFDNKGTAQNGFSEHAGNLTLANGAELANGGTFQNAEGSNLIISDGAKVTNGDGDGTSASITNSGIVYLQGDASGYKGKFEQSDGGTEVKGKFFGGESTVKGGILNWFTKEDLGSDAKLNISAEEGKTTTFNVGNNDDMIGKITFGDGSSISEEVTTNIGKGSTLTVNGSKKSGEEGTGGVTLSKGVWNGTVELKDGDLTLKDLNNNGSSGVLTAEKGNLTLDGTTELVLGKKSSVAKDVVTDIGEKSKVFLKEGTLTMDTADTWSGAVVLEEDSNGKLILDAYKKDLGTLQAGGGAIDITNGSEITFGYDAEKKYYSGIGKAVETTIDSDSKVTLKEGGYLELDDETGTADTWQGTVVLDGGIFDYGVKEPQHVGTLQADKGNLNLLSGSVLNIGHPSAVKDEVAVDIQKGATVDIQKDADFTIDSATGDKWHGLVKNEGGKFTTKGLTNRDGVGGHLQQTSGSSTFDEKSDILISGTDSFITGGDVTVSNSSSLAFASGNDLTLGNLSVTGNSTFSILNGVGQTVKAKELSVDGKNDFALDVDLRGGTSDKFTFDSIKGGEGGSGGNINVSDFGFVGGAPVYRNVEVQLFDSSNIASNVTFSATDKQVMTPIGEYGLSSLGGGKYLASLGNYNPKVFRGQVATLAAYNNQLAINDIMLNHVMLNSEKSNFGAKRSSLANRYAAVNPLFAPYQYTKKEGGLWYKSYVDIEKLSMTQNLNVHNTAYGSIVGADLPLVELKNGWDFIPTFYVAYNGAHQSYNGVGMYQNGGQGGFMGTFMKNDFIGSVLAYGGGYFNEMNVAGFNDKTGNWFAGTAAKAAYNFHLGEYFTLQPTALVSYNAFGKQSWGTDFGVMGMNSGMLNGVNVAPGLNLIYARDTWSVYATFQYMFNINDHVGGHAGVDVNLPNVSMRHGYFQYGIGATKTWKDRLNSYLQFVIRNGGRTGVGFQLGLQYLFDWNDISIGSGKSVKTSKTTVKKDKNAQKAKTAKTTAKSAKTVKTEKPAKTVNKTQKEVPVNAKTKAKTSIWDKLFHRKNSKTVTTTAPTPADRKVIKQYKK